MLQSDRCKTDPNEECEFKQKRIQVKQFIHNSQEQSLQMRLLFKQDLDKQSKKIKERIQKRKFNKPILKSSSCGIYISESLSQMDNEEYQDDIFEDAMLELDNQRDEKIYRIVKHYNNQINNLRTLELNEEILQQMMFYEKKKWDDIQIIHEQYEAIKSLKQ